MKLECAHGPREEVLSQREIHPFGPACTSYRKHYMSWRRAARGLQALDIVSKFGKAICEGMPAAIEFAKGCLRKFFGIEGKMRKRHHRIVAAVVEKNLLYFRKV